MIVIYEYQIPAPGTSTPPSLFGPSGQLISFTPDPLQAQDVMDLPIEELSTCVGTYGMGGPGFFGLRLENQKWLVIAIWGAADCIHVDNRLIENTEYSEQDLHPPPWIREHDTLSPQVIGHTIRHIEIQCHSMYFELSNGMRFSIEEDAATRPVWPGNQKPRAFNESDDLRRAVFLAPTAEIWV